MPENTGTRYGTMDDRGLCRPSCDGNPNCLSGCADQKAENRHDGQSKEKRQAAIKHAVAVVKGNGFVRRAR